MQQLPQQLTEVLGHSNCGWSWSPEQSRELVLLGLVTGMIGYTFPQPYPLQIRVFTHLKHMRCYSTTVVQPNPYMLSTVLYYNRSTIAAVPLVLAVNDLYKLQTFYSRIAYSSITMSNPSVQTFPSRRSASGERRCVLDTNNDNRACACGCTFFRLNPYCSCSGAGLRGATTSD
jgi:hypothetical protein